MTKPILCGSIYRPPKQSDFYGIIENALEAVSTHSQETILLGDFNTDVSLSKNCPLV